jgi:hypothetical protein
MLPLKMTEVDPFIQAFAKKLVLDTEAEVLQKIRVRAAAFPASEVGLSMFPKKYTWA